MAGSHQVNKPHKSRFSSKSSLNVHRTSSLKEKSKNFRTDNRFTKGARASRIQRSKMAKEHKREALLKQKRVSAGSSSPPRVIVLFGLSASVNLDALEEDFLSLLAPDGNSTLSGTVASPEYKLRVKVLKAPRGDLVACMEMAKIADLIAFVASVNSCYEDGASPLIDTFGNQCLSIFRSLGLPSTVVFIRDLPVELKRRQELKKICTSSLALEFPEDCKFYPADKKDELHKFFWLFKEQRLTLPHWRAQRPYLMADKVEMIADDCNSNKCTLLLTGYLRAHNLSVNQLVHVSGAGDFQLSRIECLEDPFPLHPRKDNLMDSDIDGRVSRALIPDSTKQEPLFVENIPDPLAGEQTWPTENEMVEADRSVQQKKRISKVLPRGTSDYQAAWIVDGTDEDENEDGDVVGDDDMVLDEKENDFPGYGRSNHSVLDEDCESLRFGDSDEGSDIDSMMTEGDNFTREKMEDEMQKIKTAHADDKEYPDEVDTPIDTPARKRFAKYRGLKSFRTSSWDPKESLPPEYGRIFAFDNFKRTQKHVLAKASEMDVEVRDDSIAVGSYAKLHIKEVPCSIASRLCAISTTPVIACGLLQHESKISVLHFSIKKHDSYDAPIKAKEEFTFHVGFRKFVGRPIFSTDGIHADKHKMERFLHEGGYFVASIYAPISFPPLPLIMLKRGEGGTAPAVAAVGSLKSIDADRIILKRIVLTGYPQRVSKSKASVRYMFHNPEDVKWFKPVELRTKEGLRGRIKEPVGTHGFMKCVLNGVLKQNDTVCMNLYKRAYPKWPDHIYPNIAA